MGARRDWRLEERRMLEHYDMLEIYPYPDLDFVPKYPWAGGGNITNNSNDVDQLPQHPGSPIVHDGFVPQEPRSAAWDNLHGQLKTRDHFGSSKNVATSALGYNTRSHGLKDSDDPLLHADHRSFDEDALSDEIISEADSDFHALDAQESSRNAGRRGRRGRGGRGRTARTGRGGKGVKRGQRKALEPSSEFQALHSQATMSFIDRDYDEAERLTQQAILINPEMFPAHSLLSEIHMARGDKEKALSALFHGAHTRPRDPKLWSKVAQLILERAGENRTSGLPDAIYCYNRIIGLDATNTEARYQRASLNRELGHKGRAAYEYELLLRYLPHDTIVLRHLADIYIELDEAERAICHYNDTISHYRLTEPWSLTKFTWSDVNIYTELYNFQGQYEEGISKLKSLARWLVGRNSDVIWETFDEDDREWDARDYPRRVKVEGFESGKYGLAAYGDGLPLELRVKLGLYRLKLGGSNIEEAFSHFEWLEPEDDRAEAKLFDYADLFREAADALRVENLHQESLRYYDPLQQVENYTDNSYFMDVAFCYRAIGLVAEAEDCYRQIIDGDEVNIEARVQLAKMHQENGMPERASIYYNEVYEIEKRESKLLSLSWPSTGPNSNVDSSPSVLTMLAPRNPHQPKRPSALQREIGVKTKKEDIQLLFVRLQGLTERLRPGDEELKLQWMNAAKTLTQAFRSKRSCLSREKDLRSGRQLKETRLKSPTLTASYGAEEVGFVSGRLRFSSYDIGASSNPNHPQNIPCQAWLDVFLRYALMLAQNGDTKVAYEIMSAASDADVFLNVPDSQFLIHVCWFTSAMIANDEETLCNVARWFTKEFQFVNDAYRLYSALHSLCGDFRSWYNSGPSQKYILRQIKAMDYSLADEDRRRTSYYGKASYTTKDENGDPIYAEEMDVGLLMLYGHILFVGKSYAVALNYFLRAYALDPTNPMINLSLALGYLHYAVKRQSENRHHLVMQGFAFLFAYYNVRQHSNVVSEREEAEYNVARAYHMLGLSHLAIPYYERCLALAAQAHVVGHNDTTESYVREAAVALQGLWATSGDYQLAREVTEKWLVL